MSMEERWGQLHHPETVLPVSEQRMTAGSIVSAYKTTLLARIQSVYCLCMFVIDFPSLLR